MSKNVIKSSFIKSPAGFRMHVSPRIACSMNMPQCRVLHAMLAQKMSIKLLQRVKVLRMKERTMKIRLARKTNVPRKVRILWKAQLHLAAMLQEEVLP